MTPLFHGPFDQPIELKIGTEDHLGADLTIRRTRVRLIASSDPAGGSIEWRGLLRAAPEAIFVGWFEWAKR